MDDGGGDGISNDEYNEAAVATLRTLISKNPSGGIRQTTVKEMYRRFPDKSEDQVDELLSKLDESELPLKREDRHVVCTADKYEAQNELKKLTSEIWD